MKGHRFSIILLIMVCACGFDSPKKRTLFILGDSISLQYGSYLEKELAEDFIIQRKGSQEAAMRNLDVPVDANGGDSRMVLSYLKTRINDPSFRPDLMLLNCGLHDIKRNPATGMIAIDSSLYRQNLDSIFQLLGAKKIPVIWVRTTEVIDSIHNEKSKAFFRYSKDVDQYNAIADEVCAAFKIDRLDLYGYTRGLGQDRFADHVHYISRVIKEQAIYIGKYIESWKKKKR